MSSQQRDEKSTGFVQKQWAVKCEVRGNEGELGQVRLESLPKPGRQDLHSRLKNLSFIL